MSVNDLYQKIVLRHFKTPSHFGPVSSDEASAEVENPLCGDHIRLLVKVEEGRIADIRFDGKGCAISTASASLMTEQVLGRTPEEARRLIADFGAVLRGEKRAEDVELGDLMALENVRRYPLRVKCALLAWDALRDVLGEQTD